MVSKKQQEPLLGEDCPVRQVISIVGDKWTLPVLYMLKDETKRYSQLQKDIPGISKKMLTQTLRKLESDNIVNRKVYPVVPPKTEYSLTTFGNKLIKPLGVLADWAWAHEKELKIIYEKRDRQTILRRSNQENAANKAKTISKNQK